jgi:hypothetical protein
MLLILSKKNKQNENGQILLIVLFIMSIALAVGISMSNRFISNLRNRSETDDSSKAMSMAEAAIEKILLISSDTLKTYAQNGTCGSNCHFQVTGSNGQIISADVVLTLTGQSTNEAYPVSINPSQSVEITLNGYTSNQNVYICWNTAASVEAIYMYNQSGVIKATPYAFNSTLASHPENGFTTATSLFGYSSCGTIAASQTPLAIRLKPYYVETTAYLLPAAGYALPVQGILITSTGKAGNARRIATVLKTNPYTPTPFDYVLYQKSENDPLSN